MASVFWHRGRWYMKWKNAPGRLPRYVKAAGDPSWSKKRAEHEANARERHAQIGELPLEGAEAMTLAELCRWWLGAWCKPASHARELSRLKANVLEQPIGALRLRDITAAAIEGRLREMEEAGAASASVEHVRRTLRTVFNRARKAKVWDRNPAADVDARSMDPVRETRPLTAEEVASVVAAIAEPWKRDLVVAAFYTAMRKGELLALEQDAVDLKALTVRIERSHGRGTTKGGHKDTIPLAAPVLPYLKHAIEAAKGSALVFPGPDGDRRPATTDAVAIVQKALRDAGIVEGWDHLCRRKHCRDEAGAPHVERHAERREGLRCPRCGMRLWSKAVPRPFTFHALRHTAASLLVRAKVGLPQLQRIMRHRSIDTTIRRYAHLYDDDLRAALAMLPALPPPPEVKAEPFGEPVAAVAGTLVPTLSPLGRIVKKKGPESKAETAVNSGPSMWRAIQDSNLWPSAPEAGQRQSAG